ncbi:hypothetical protein [Photobacterium sanctipauli]|uniref:hypothetical protein n=1 Tax=Photobacterium sanctipauli TaxID=1342794 RepID=UPI00068B633A|nr:hypothetical protein [Photobacterium sanctipauli]
MVSLKRGQPGNHRHDEKLKLQTLALLQQQYEDFGPTLAHEKFAELHDIHVSVETLRQWMIADGLWLPHAKRKPRVYQPRHRRDCLSELVHIDGSLDNLLHRNKFQFKIALTISSLAKSQFISALQFRSHKQTFALL